MSRKANREVPKLRFSEFEGDWQYKTVQDISKKVSSGSSKVTREVGRYPVYGSTGIIGKSEQGGYSGEAILIARVGANAGKISLVDGVYGVTDNTIIVVLDKSNNISFFKSQLEIKRLNSMVFGSGQPLITGTQIKSLKIAFPSIAEQEKIASFLGAIDTRLTQLRRKHELLQTYKRGVMQKLFSQQIRFKGDDGKPFPDWETTLVRDIATNISSGRSKASKDFGNYPVYGSTGIIGKSETGDYSGESILIARVGANAGKISFVSGVYGVTDNTIIVNTISSYNIHLLRIQLEMKRLNSMVFGSGQPLITGTQIKKLQLVCPKSIEEQEKIANFLTAIDHKFEAVAKQIDLTERFKKGLLQKMFV